MGFDAMQNAAKSMKTTANNMDIGRTIGDAISAPMGTMAEFDDDELDQELELLEEEALDESLLNVTTVDSLDLPSVPTSVPQAKQKTKKNTEEDELAALQAAMAM